MNPTNLLVVLVRMLGEDMDPHTSTGRAYIRGRPHRITSVSIPDLLIELYDNELQYNIKYDPEQRSYVITTAVEVPLAETEEPAEGSELQPAEGRGE